MWIVRHAAATKPRRRSRVGALVCMTDHAFAQAPWRCVIASLAGAIVSGAVLCFAADAASAEEPLKLAGSQLEPVKWSELSGWASDDHLAAFAAYQAGCRAARKRPRTDDHGRSPAP